MNINTEHVDDKLNGIYRRHTAYKEHFDRLFAAVLEKPDIVFIKKVNGRDLFERKLKVNLNYPMGTTLLRISEVHTVINNEIIILSLDYKPVT